MTRKTKIIATIGPTSSSIEIIKQMILEGVNVCRINFSHGSHKENIEAINNIRKVDAELGLNTAIIADLQGPKIRIGDMPEEGVLLEKGKKYSLQSSQDLTEWKELMNFEAVKRINILDVLTDESRGYFRLRELSFDE